MIESPLPLPPAPTTPAEWILPTLTRAQIARIETRGSVRQIQRGEVLVEAGEAVVPFFVVTAGQMEVVRPSGATETIIYQSKMHPTLTRNFEVFSATDWLAALTAHIPNAGEYLVRYYGWSSNVSRGKRRKAQGEESATIEEFNEVSASAAKRA